MALYYNVGGTFVSEEELLEKRIEVEKFRSGEAKSIEFSTGAASLDDAQPEQFMSRTGEVKPFVEIGPNKPLAIWIASAYVGSLPRKTFGGSRGVLVTSAVKSWQTFDLQPRALNIIKKSVKKQQSVTVAAVEEGTPIVFYTKAAIDRQLILTTEMAFDDVDQAFFDTISEVFKGAAGLPVFASASPYLLAASTLFKLGGTVGNRIFDSRAEFQANEKINLDLAGTRIAKAGYALLTKSEMDAGTLADFTPSDTGELVKKSDGTRYSGDVPYMILALDGAEDPDLDAFKAHAASAALMQQFYNVREGGDTDAKILLSALGLYNDFRFKSEADKVQKLIDAEADPEKKKKLEARLAAIIKNIQSEEFKPKKSGGGN